ncbi:hypothetical protein HY483_00205 [Candidatus Woesearchaeota archaeon]|nr:hypothetical protein [Candidatus Woesearchaeota archaeon]
MAENILKSVIVDSDGKVYIDSSIGDVSSAEMAIAPFTICVFRDPVNSSLYEFEIVPEKIISSIASGTSLEEILEIFGKFSSVPIPLNVFSDFKHVEQSSGINISGSVQEGFRVRSNNWKLLESLAKSSGSFSKWNASNGFLSVPSEDLSNLQEALSGIHTSGVDISCMIEEYELLFRDGVPLKYMEGRPDVSIINSGECKIVVGSSFGELERIILDAREIVRNDISVFESNIPSEFRECIRQTLDDSSRGELWKDHSLRSLLKYSFLFVKHLLSDNIDRGLTSEGVNYLFKIRDCGRYHLLWKYVTSVCRAKGWNFVDPDEIYKNDLVRFGRVLFPERIVAKYYKKNMFIHTFLLGGPGFRSMDDVRADIGNIILDGGSRVEGVVGADCYALLNKYFCQRKDLRDVSRSSPLAYYQLAEATVNGLTLLVRAGILDGIVSPATKEKLSQKYTGWEHEQVRSTSTSPVVKQYSPSRVIERRIDEERERRMKKKNIDNEHVASTLRSILTLNQEVLGAPVENVQEVIAENIAEKDVVTSSKEVDTVEVLPTIPQQSSIVVPIPSSSQFFNHGDRLYQRCDVVEREWQVSLAGMKERCCVETLDCDERYILLSENFLREVSRLSYLDSMITRTKGFLPRRASRLLRRHFWDGFALFEMGEFSKAGVLLKGGNVVEDEYSSLLQEVEECVTLSRIFSRGLSPQFLRRRLFEGGMEFIPSYKMYSEFGVPSSLVFGRFGERVFSIEYERGVVASSSNNLLFESVVHEISDGVKKYAGLLPPACRSVLDAVFNPQEEFRSELDACSSVVGTMRELAVEVLTGFDMLQHSLKISLHGGIPPNSYYSRLRDVSANYHVQQRTIKRLTGVDVFTACGAEYVRMDNILAGVLERLSGNQRPHREHLCMNEIANKMI